MSAISPDLSAIRSAVQAVDSVRGVSSLVPLTRDDDAMVIVARVGLSPLLRLPDVVYAISEVELAVRRADPRVAAVFVEPDIAADAATPTETIVIRALD